MVAAFQGRRMMPGKPFRVVWTRGEGCVELADLLGGGSSTRVQGDLRTECVEARADLLVTRRLPVGFDFVNVAVPSDFDPAKVGSVSAAVSSGPHSALAARIALRLGETLGVEAEMISAYPTPADFPAAEQIVRTFAGKIPGLPYRVVETADARELIEALPADALLVLGAPGGWWLQRSFFGTGVRLRQRAPAGAIVVQQAPARVYHHMEEPAYLSRHLLVGDALRLMEHAVAAVVDEGNLVGVIHKGALEGANPELSVGELMDDPLFLEVGDSYEEASRLADLFDGSPIPVVDGAGRLVGGLTASGS
ncbi:MAG: CBS domain-containing protein [Acidimicrobiia bacterium]|nr:CBS domain-containing protein [Acidimicrobiia bacterium]MDH3396560.1 CBS domain-containing protein [Acidimicrobiia bacterium]